MNKILDNYLDIWCISLKCRDDRYQSAVAEFAKHKLIVKFHRPEKDPLGGEKGCYESHLHCFNESKKKNKHALIFEDDIKFNTNFNIKNMKKVIKFITNNEWDSFKLSAMITYYIAKHSAGIMQCKSLNTHAIIYNKKLTIPLFDTLAIDEYFNRNHLTEYVIEPQLGLQNGQSSDIVWRTNMAQSLLEHKYLYEGFQKLNNWQLYKLRFLPTCVQKYSGVWYFMGMLGNTLHKLISCGKNRH